MAYKCSVLFALLKEACLRQKKFFLTCPIVACISRVKATAEYHFHFGGVVLSPFLPTEVGCQIKISVPGLWAFPNCFNHVLIQNLTLGFGKNDKSLDIICIAPIFSKLFVLVMQGYQALVSVYSVMLDDPFGLLRISTCTPM